MQRCIDVNATFYKRYMLTGEITMLDRTEQAQNQTGLNKYNPTTSKLQM